MDTVYVPSASESAKASGRRKKVKLPQERFLGRVVTRSPLPAKVKEFLNMDAGVFFSKLFRRG